MMATQFGMGSMSASTLQQQPRQARPASRRVVETRAIFGRKAAVVVEEPPAPAKRSGGLFGRKAAVVVEEPPAPAKRGGLGGLSWGPKKPLPAPAVPSAPAKRQLFKKAAAPAPAAAKPAAKASSSKADVNDKAAKYS
jgi:hypothetical protein